jgi:hypothetical protein
MWFEACKQSHVELITIQLLLFDITSSGRVLLDGVIGIFM